MRVELSGVSKGRRGVALPETTAAFASGRASLVVAETEQRPTVLGLIASGRMRPDSGSVTIDGEADAGALRRRVALIDAPDVSDPAPNVALAGVIAEELMFAGLRSDPISARRWLHQHGVRGLSRVPIADVVPAVRLRLLLELAVLRPGVDAIVLVSPDRHGGDPRSWWALAGEFAARGLAVLVISGEASAALLAATPKTSRPRPDRLRLRAGAPLARGARR
ncbi:hypothetical protein [Microbacterium ulmi]|uniref:ABC transporter ATP-binding protein n=1 Tax=Microbacterium ulmi TaxID=179095 RepID=A0A7Y2M1S6_9MICO|nr:hypothetical protein [Microbacterium ulmi]NII69489.1 hypothetical protein [Microbacterium ulmi]NNH04910.1 hypothetical protein [Microbacterium ulmi]